MGSTPRAGHRLRGPRNSSAGPPRCRHRAGTPSRCRAWSRLGWRCGATSVPCLSRACSSRRSSMPSGASWSRRPSRGNGPDRRNSSAMNRAMPPRSSRTDAHRAPGSASCSPIREPRSGRSPRPRANRSTAGRSRGASPSSHARPAGPSPRRTSRRTARTGCSPSRRTTADTRCTRFRPAGRASPRSSPSASSGTSTWRRIRWIPRRPCTCRWKQ